MTKYPWIVLKYDVNPNIMICERCKYQQEMPHGMMQIDMMLGIMKTFEKIHKRCRVKT